MEEMYQNKGLTINFMLQTYHFIFKQLQSNPEMLAAKRVLAVFPCDSIIIILKLCRMIKLSQVH